MMIVSTASSVDWWKLLCLLEKRNAKQNRNQHGIRITVVSFFTIYADGKQQWKNVEQRRGNS